MCWVSIFTVCSRSALSSTWRRTYTRRSSMNAPASWQPSSWSNTKAETWLSQRKRAHQSEDEPYWHILQDKIALLVMGQSREQDPFSRLLNSRWFDSQTRGKTHPFAAHLRKGGAIFPQVRKGIGLQNISGARPASVDHGYRSQRPQLWPHPQYHQWNPWRLNRVQKWICGRVGQGTNQSLWRCAQKLCFI